MHVLQKIVEHKREEVRRRRFARAQADEALRTMPRPRDFESALRKSGMSVIAEIKRRSPSKGVICKDVRVGDVARTYTQGGAAALSVLTDSEFFGGAVDDLQEAHASSPAPILRKDFTVDESQIYESRVIGADAILLIVRILDDAQLCDFLSLAEELGMAALVEVHDERELDRAITANARIIGVNSRDLDTFEVNLWTAVRLKSHIPSDCIAVAESGIHTHGDVRLLEHAGFDAVLVGESLMRAADPAVKLAELLGTSA